jgi:hypothetical protein
MRVNDDGTYTDTTPFTIDTNGNIGIATTSASVKLDLNGLSGIDAFRLSNSGTKVLGLSYGTNHTTMDIISSDPTNKLTNPSFDTDISGWNLSEGGWWVVGEISASNAIAAYQSKASASLAASYSNLANPGTYNLTATVAPTWDTTSGWIFTGTQFLKTGIQPSDSTWSYLI